MTARTTCSTSHSTPSPAPDTSVSPSPDPRFAGRTLRWLEWLSTTRANGYAGLAADTGIGLALLYAGMQRADVGAGVAAWLLAGGLVLFSLIEYCMHRWLFHGSLAIFEHGHRKHHEQPEAYDSLPFFVPPLATLLLTGILALAMPTTAALLLAAGVAVGYAAYGLTHTAFHTVRLRRWLSRRWAAAHHVHHCHPGINFGVTTPLWDILLQTRYVSARKRAGQ